MAKIALSLFGIIMPDRIIKFPIHEDTGSMSNFIENVHSYPLLKTRGTRPPAPRWLRL